jgi:[DsrC]-trisulfide reductase subunit M
MMSVADVVSFFIVAFAYLSLGVFFVGVAYRIYLYAKAPAPLNIALTPGPKTPGGVVARLTGDVLLFQNLFKADKVLWAGSWVFHASLFLTLVRHLRYFLYPVPGFIIDWQTVSLYAGYLLPLTTVYLFWRRLASLREFYTSGVPDYGVLILLGCIAGTGLLVRYVARVYVVDIKAFALGLVTLHPVAPPMHPIFIFHFLLVCLLLIYFPYSKLMHAGGVFFSPTRNQPYNLAQRHVNPWNQT